MANEAPADQDRGRSPFALHREEERGRTPNDERAEHGNDGEQAHDGSPDQRRGKFEPPEDQASHRSLHDGDNERAEHRGMNHVVRAAEREPRLGIGQRHQRAKFAEHRFSIAKEEEQGHERREELHAEPRGAGEQRADAARDRACGVGDVG